MTTIADLIVSTLAGSGVQRIWGVTGDSLNALNAAQAQDGRMAFMHVRHEEAAAFAAGAEAARHPVGARERARGAGDDERVSVIAMAAKSRPTNERSGPGRFR